MLNLAPSLDLVLLFNEYLFKPEKDQLPNGVMFLNSTFMLIINSVFMLINKPDVGTPFTLLKSVF